MVNAPWNMYTAVCFHFPVWWSVHSILYSSSFFFFHAVMHNLTPLIPTPGQSKSLRLFFSDRDNTCGQLVIASRESQYKIFHFHHGGLDKLAAVFEDWNFLVKPRDEEESPTDDTSLKQFLVCKWVYFLLVLFLLYDMIVGFMLCLNFYLNIVDFNITHLYYLLIVPSAKVSLCFLLVLILVYVMAVDFVLCLIFV